MAESIKRILITAENYYPIGGGIQQYIRYFSKHLVSRGIDVHIMCQSYEEVGDTAELWGSTVHYTDLFTGSMGDPFTVIDKATEIAKFIKEIDPDFVYANNHNSLAVITACKQIDMPVVYGCHGVGLFDPLKTRLLRPDDTIWAEDRGLWGTYTTFARKKDIPRKSWNTIKRFYREVYPDFKKYRWGESILNSADARLCNSTYTTKLFTKKKDTVGIPLMLEYEGEHGFFPEDPNEFKKEHGLDKYVVVVGRLNHIKGQEYVIDAIPDMPSDVKVVFVGTPRLWSGDKDELGSYGEQLEKRIEELGVKDRVVFAGFKQPHELRAIYTGAVAAIVPSIWFETFGYVVVEPVACETPVIVTRNCGAVECLNDECAVVIERKDPKAIAEAVQKVYPVHKEMGRVGRGYLMQNYSPEKLTDQTLELFERCIANHG